MITIKVTDATNLQLDWLMANALHEYSWNLVPRRFMELQATREFCYTTDWTQMGPILDRIDGVLLKRWVETRPEMKCQVEIHNMTGDWIAFGPTLCVAAARCYVMSKLGDFVEVPDEL